MSSKPHSAAIDDLPPPLDSETLALLRAFLSPIIEAAPSWGSLQTTLAARGYRLVLRSGRLVVLNDTGRAVCTGRCLGVSMATLAERLGRPHVRSDRAGRSGWIH